MTGQLIGQLILWLIVVVVIAILYWVMQWLYRRSTKEVAFVRTGFLGEKVVIDGFRPRNLARTDVAFAVDARTIAVEADEISARESTERLRIAQGAQLEIARVQALREAEIESREDVERARIASERELEEIRIDH